MLNINALSIKEAQKFKAFLVEQKNSGNESTDSLIFELERSVRLRKAPEMSPEAIVRAKARKQKNLERKGKNTKPIIYTNICPECNRGEIVSVSRDGIKYETCGRLIDKRLQVGCGYSRMVK